MAERRAEMAERTLREERDKVRFLTELLQGPSRSASRGRKWRRTAAGCSGICPRCSTVRNHKGRGMNYYEHHIGDFAQATAHLSFVEDAAYSRLIRKYYAEEKPLPGDLKAVQRLVGARTKEERKAVADILDEFFKQDADGWHNKRCDAEIARYKDSAEDRDAAKANEKERQRRHREERKDLFNQLRDVGIVPKWDTPTAKLRELLSDYPVRQPVTVTDTDMSQPVTQPVTVTDTDMSQPVTQPVTPDNTANQSPVTSHQTPELTPTTVSSVVNAKPESREPSPDNATRKGALSKQLRSLGIDAAPHLQGWVELLPAYSDAEILAAAETAREKKPGERLHLNYLLPILRDRAAPNHSRKSKPKKFDPVAYVNRNRNSSQGDGNAPESAIINGTAERVA